MGWNIRNPKTYNQSGTSETFGRIKLVRSLNRLLRPKTIAVYGGSWSENVVKELKKNSFLGEIWAVHPTKKSIGGVKRYRTTFDLH